MLGKLFKGGNYSRAETICGNMVVIKLVPRSIWYLGLTIL